MDDKLSIFKEDLKELKNQIISCKTCSKEACQFFQFLSGKSGNVFADSIGISHTYWNDLIRGNRVCPSDEVKERIARYFGFSFDVVKYMFEEPFDFNVVYQGIINYVEQSYNAKINSASSHHNFR